MEFFTQVIFPTFCTAAIVYICFLIKNWLPSYYSEKGKNLATKEDISAITNIVEGVKNAFTTETEKLKSTLNLIANLRTSIFSEERNAIISLHEKYFIWFNLLTDPNIIYYEISSELQEHSSKIKHAYRELQAAEARFNLFIETGELTEKASDLIDKTMENLPLLSANYCIDMESILLDIRDAENDNNTASYSDNITALHNKMKNAKEEYITKMLEYHADVISLFMSFQKLSRQHIYLLLKRAEESQL